MKKTVLLVIDTQQALLDMGAYRGAEMLDAIGRMLLAARTHGREDYEIGRASCRERV